MYFASRPIIKRRRSVSEVMGALLLIVVVIVAVATLASFVSIAEKNANNRSALLTNLKDENLQIVNAAFQANKSLPFTWSNVTVTIRNSNTADSQLTQIKFSNATFNYWFPQWKVLSSTGVIQGTYCVQACLNRTGGLVTNGTLIFPAKATLTVFLKLTKGKSLAFQRNSSASVTLLTADGNFFTVVYNPPTAAALVGITSISYQHFSRDIVTVDGSGSQSSNTTKITSYLWTVDVPLTNSTHPAFVCSSAQFSYTNNYTAVTFSGETTQFHQEAFASLLPPGPYCLTGPFQVSLEVTDSLGFISISQPTIVSMDSDMAPPASFNATTSETQGLCVTGASPGSCTITGYVETIFGTPPSPHSATVLISYPGGTAAAVVSSTTGMYTSPSISCSTAGSIMVSLNQLPSEVLSC